MRKNISILSSIFILLSVLTGCNRSNEKFIGPGICPGSDFTIVEPFAASQNSVDFPTGAKAVNFTAKFNETVSWTVTITGLETGAKKAFSGRSAEVNVSWKGEPGNIVFFGTEKTISVLTIGCLSNQYTQEVDITKVSNFSNYGILVTDFDGNGLIPGAFAADWYKYGPGLVDAESNISTGPVSSSPQGGKYMRIKGDLPAGGYFSAGASSNNFDLTSLVGSNPDSVYFNAFIYGTGNTNSYMAITVSEKDRKRTKLLDVTWTGWRLVTLKFSDFFPYMNPKDVKSIAFDLSAKDPAPGKNNGEEIIDFIIITNGKAFY